MQKQMSAMEVMERYFDAVDRFDPDAAAECFSPDAFYSHPPYPGGISGGFDRGPDTRIEVRTRERLRDLFEARGKRPVQHRVTTCVSEGDAAFAEGSFESSAGEGSFIISIRLDEDGLIKSFAAYASSPGVGQALDE